MPSEKNNILELNQYMKSNKMPYIIYTNMESFEKIDGCANNPENSSTTEIVEQIPCRYSMSTTCAFDHIENTHSLYRGKDYIKKFCEFLREHAKNIINFKKTKMILPTKEERQLHQDAKAVMFVEKESSKSSLKV